MKNILLAAALMLCGFATFASTVQASDNAQSCCSVGSSCCPSEPCCK